MTCRDVRPEPNPGKGDRSVYVTNDLLIPPPSHPSVVTATISHEYTIITGQISPILKFNPHFDLNYTPVEFHDCILHSCSNNRDYKIFPQANRSIKAATSVSRTKLCLDDTHTHGHYVNTLLWLVTNLWHLLEWHTLAGLTKWMVVKQLHQVA